MWSRTIRCRSDFFSVVEFFFTLFKVKSRLWVRTLNEIQRKDIEISSKLVSRVTKLPYGVNPSYLGYQTHVVTTQVGIFALKIDSGGA